jgi:hypothetical protein
MRGSTRARDLDALVSPCQLSHMGSIAYAVGGPWHGIRKTGLVLAALCALALISYAAFGALGEHGAGGSAGRVSRTSLVPFTRHIWWGHGRSFRIEPSGWGLEQLRTYLPKPPVYQWLTFAVVSVSGPPTSAVARIRVTSEHHFGADSGISVGTLGYLRIRNGVITDSITRATYCAPEVGRCGT